MLLKRQKTRLHKTLGVFGAITYRLPLPIKEVVVYRSGNHYPRCPRCGQSMDREYMHFCDRCGQKLGWSKFANGEFRRVVL